MSETKLFAAIGSFIVSFNALEHFVSEEICRELALEGQNLTDTFNAAMGFSYKVDLLTARVLDDQEIKKTSKERKLKLLEELRKMNDRRNLIVHSAYGVYDQTRVMRRSKLRGAKGLKIDTSQFDFAEMRVAAERNVLWMFDWMFVDCD